MVTEDQERRGAVGAKVRPMTAEDIDEALAMFGAVAEEGMWLGTEAGFDVQRRRDAWLAGLDDPTQRAFVAVTDEGDNADDIVGMASFALTAAGVADIGMAVVDRWRGRGLGGRLLDALISAAGEVGAHKVALQVWPHNQRAIALYQSRGFAVEGRLLRHYRRRNGEIWDAVVMGLPLDETSPGSPHDETAGGSPRDREESNRQER